MARKTHSVKFLQPGCIAWFWNHKTKEAESCTVIDLLDEDGVKNAMILTKEGTKRRMRKLRLYKHKGGVSKYWGSLTQVLNDIYMSHNSNPNSIDNFIVTSVQNMAHQMNVSMNIFLNTPVDYVTLDFETKEENND